MDLINPSLPEADKQSLMESFLQEILMQSCHNGRQGAETVCPSLHYRLIGL
jgi:hypothetical protein